VLLVGDCQSQEVIDNVPKAVQRFCELSESGDAAYKLRDVELTVFPRGSGAFALFGSAQRPDGIDGEAHYLNYSNRAWSAPESVARSSVWSVERCAVCVAVDDEASFLVARESELVGRWIGAAN